MADSYEQKPKYWSFFPMSDDEYRKKEDFFDEKGWDMDKVPTHSGKMTLPDGTVVRFEGRMVEGNRGDYWTGTCYIPEKQPSRGGNDRRSSRRDDRDGRRDDRRDDRRSRDDRPARDDRRDDRRSDRDRSERSRDRDDLGRSQSSFDHDLDDDVPF